MRVRGARGFFCLGVLVSFVYCSLFSSVAVAADAGAERALKQLQKSYRGCKTLRARFKQRRQLRVANRKWISKGRLVFKRPGKISFRYASGNRVVSDGKRVIIYTKKDKIVYRSSLKRSLHAAAVSYLLGKGRLQRDFRWRLLKSKHKGLVLRGEAKRKSALFQSMVLQLDDKARRVLRLMIVDAQGNTNRFVFSKIRCRVPVSKKEFRFRPPAGVKVIRI